MHFFFSPSSVFLAKVLGCAFPRQGRSSKERSLAAASRRKHRSWLCSRLGPKGCYEQFVVSSRV